MSLLQINKTKARNLFNDGLTIYLLPNKVRLENVWLRPYPINIFQSEEHSFDVLLANFEYYNCNAETGKGVHYYIADFDSVDIKTLGGTILMHYNKGNNEDILSKLQRELNILTERHIPVRSVIQEGTKVTVTVEG